MMLFELCFRGGAGPSTDSEWFVFWLVFVSSFSTDLLALGVPLIHSCVVWVLLFPLPLRGRR